MSADDIQSPEGTTSTPTATIPTFDPGVTPGDAPLPSDPSATVGAATHHGSRTREFLAPHSKFYQGGFGRMFPDLPPWVPPGASDESKVEVIRQIAEMMFEEGRFDPDLDNPRIPSGYTYFGQFVDHDITFDPASSMQRHNDPEGLHNFRTPKFDLDNLYGEGPDDEPFLYDHAAGREGAFLIGKGRDVVGVDPPMPVDAVVDMRTLALTEEDDLPRNEQGKALIGDMRNDENIIVSQMQLVFLKLHNRLLEHVVTQEGLSHRQAYLRAQNLVRWHYQWVVLFDFVKRLAGEEMLNGVISRAEAAFTNNAHLTVAPYDINLRFYGWRYSPFMPVEFSAAAYRLGHSMVRQRYDLNNVVKARPIFSDVDDPEGLPEVLKDLRGFRPLPPQWTLDWDLYLGDGPDMQPSRKIDTRLAPGLRTLPVNVAGHGGATSLAFRNLLRGFRMGLPSGQAVARAMGVRRARIQEVEDGWDHEALGHEMPLWHYILKEAEIGGGEMLGPVGGRIIAEVFTGLAKGDPNCFLNIDPGWTPAQAGASGEQIIPFDGDLELKDL
ncbi:MAG: heme peroxidase family protein, partial [Dehalococcoidia bacterium]